MSLRRKLLYGGSGVPWSPYMLGRSLLAEWWCADDHAVPALMTDDGGGLTSSWKGRINGTNLTAAGSARPTWGATSFNGLPGVTGDGVANALTLASVPSYFPTVAAPSEIMTVHSSPGADGTTRTIFGYGVAANGRMVQENASPPGLKLAGGAVVLSDTSEGSAGLHIVNAAYTGAVIEGWRNGRPFVPASVALVPNTATNRIRMFAGLGTSASQFLSGIARHILVTTGLSALQRFQLQGWAAWESGLQSVLPDSHPYKGSPP